MLGLVSVQASTDPPTSVRDYCDLRRGKSGCSRWMIWPDMDVPVTLADSHRSCIGRVAGTRESKKRELGAATVCFKNAQCLSKIIAGHSDLFVHDQDDEICRASAVNRISRHHVTRLARSLVISSNLWRYTVMRDRLPRKLRVTITGKRQDRRAGSTYLTMSSHNQNMRKIQTDSPMSLYGK